MKMLLITLMGVVLNGCANTRQGIPVSPAFDLPISAVRNNAPKYIGYDVRWGGTVIHVQNEQEYTDIQLLYYPLNSAGRPDLNQPTRGRFIIHSPEFLDPAVYVKGKELTITGKVKETVEYKVGNKTLTLPVIDVENIYEWSKYDKYRDRRYRYYPYGFYPYDYYGYPFPYRYW